MKQIMQRMLWATVLFQGTTISWAASAAQEVKYGYCYSKSELEEGYDLGGLWFRISRYLHTKVVRSNQVEGGPRFSAKADGPNVDHWRSYARSLMGPGEKPFMSDKLAVWCEWFDTRAAADAALAEKLATNNSHYRMEGTSYVFPYPGNHAGKDSVGNHAKADAAAQREAKVERLRAEAEATRKAEAEQSGRAKEEHHAKAERSRQAQNENREAQAFRKRAERARKQVDAQVQAALADASKEVRPKGGHRQGQRRDGPAAGQAHSLYPDGHNGARP